MNPADILRQGASVPPAGAVDVSLVGAAIDHGVAPLVYRALRASAAWDDLDAGVRETLSQIAREAVLVEEIRAAHLTSVVEALGAEGVRPLLFKGAALAATHYPEPWLRTRGDSDLIVRAGEAERAGAVLEGMSLARLPRPRGVLVTQQSRYIGTSRGIALAYDVHWRVADPHVFAAALPYDEIERDAVGDHPSGARRLSNVHALVAAAVHRAAHHYDTDHLLLLYDIHLLAGALTADEWSRFGELTRAKGLRTVARRGLHLASEAFGGTLPLSVQHALAGGDDEPTALYIGRRLRRIDVLRSDLQALSAWPDRVQLLWEHIFPGSDYLSASPARGSRLGRIASGARKWFRPL